MILVECKLLRDQGCIFLLTYGAASRQRAKRSRLGGTVKKGTCRFRL